jgi:hypothetical protein
MMPTSISANGGAERYWRHNNGTRACLCRNGVILIRRKGTGWKLPPADCKNALEQILTNAHWQADTRAVVRAATTRTSRQARRE